MNENRRNFERVAFADEIQCVSFGGVSREACLDLSLGGLRLAGAMNPALGETVKMFLPLRTKASGKKNLRVVEGEVVWRQQEQVGIRFRELAPEVMSEISALVALQA